MNKETANNDKESRFNKRLLHIVKKHAYLQVSLISYISVNGFKLNNNRKLVSLFDAQIRSKLKRIVIKRSFFKYNKSLLLELLELSPMDRSIIMIIVLETFFRISLVDKEVIIS